jgi:hypothetical protein
MNASLLSCLLVLVLGFLSSAAARVGETEAQCITRYGQPIGSTKTASDREGKALVFRKAPLEIVAVFDKGRAVSVTYKRKDAGGKTAEIAAAERMSLLESNGGRRKWKTLEPTKADDKYETVDGALRGHYNQNKKYLEVYDAAWNKALTKDRAAQRKAAGKAAGSGRELEGF